MSSPYDTETGPSGPAGPAGPEPEPTGPRVTRDEVRDLARLRRSRTDRKVSGVAGGIARHLDIDPLLVRVAFAILTFFGGGGLILYGVAWVLVPEEDTEDTVIHTEDGVRTAALIVAGVIAAASVIGDSIGGMDFPWPLMVVGLVLIVVLGGKQARDKGMGGFGPTEGAAGAEVADGSTGGPVYPGYRPGPPPPQKPAAPRRRGPLLFPFTVALTALGLGIVGTLDLAGVDVAPSAYPATVLGATGLMLVVGAFHGRAGGLILVGLLAAGATAATTVADELPDFSVGEVHQTPELAADVRDETLGIGDMRIDLTQVEDLDALDERTLDLEIGVGRVEVIVPDEGLDIEVEANFDGIGEIKLFGDKADQSDRATHDGGDDVPVLQIDITSLVGEIVVNTEEDAA